MILGDPTAKAPISAVIIARNEAANLPRCLGALDFCSEIVVVDDGSEDETVEIAESLGARVVSHPMRDFASQRNWSMQQADLRNTWVLHLDADEVVPRPLADEIRERVTSTGDGVAGFNMARKTMLGEKWLRYSATYPAHVARLVHRDRFRFTEVGHGDRPGKVDGRLEYLREPCLHYNFSKGLSDWFARHNRYSSREAERLIQEGAKVSWKALVSGDPVARRRAMRMLSYNLPCRPALRFLYVFLLCRGFLDGKAGFLSARLQALYERMITLKVKELRTAERPDLNP